jgi:hypothetical protein
MIRKDITAFFKALFPSEKTIEEYLRVLSAEIPSFHKLLSAFQLDRESNIRENDIWRQAAEQKLKDFTWPAIAAENLNIGNYLIYAAGIIIIAGSGIYFSGDKLIDSAARLMFLERYEPEVNLVRITFQHNAVVAKERDSLTVAAEIINNKKENPDIVFNIFKTENRIIKTISPVKNGNILTAELFLPVGDYLISGELRDEAGEKFLTDTLRLKILEKPYIKYFDLTIVPPAYTNLRKIVLPDIGNVSVLPGSVLKLRGKSNKNLLKGLVKFAGKRLVPLRVNNRNFSGSFYVRRGTFWNIELQDKDSLLFSSSPPYRIRYLEDSSPTVSILSPPGDVKLFDVGDFPLLYQIDDDFGISKVQLNYEIVQPGIPSGGFHSENILRAPAGDLPVKKEFSWNLSELGLFAGETVKYFLSAFDNNDVNGPSVAYSDTLLIIIPSLFDQLQEKEQHGKRELAKLEQARETAGEIDKKLEKIKKELLQKESMSYKMKRELRENIQNEKKLFKQIEELAKEINKKIAEEKKKEVLSENTLEKYQQIQEMMQKIISPELKKKLEELQKKLDKENTDNDKNISTLLSQIDTKKLAEEIERMYNLMKKIQEEERLQATIDALLKLAGMQKQVTDSIKENKWIRSSIFENRIGEDYQGVNSNLREIKDELKSSQIIDADTVNSLKNDFRKSVAAAIQNLQKEIGMRQKSSEKGSVRMTEIFSAMAGELINIRNQLNLKNKNELEEKITSLIRKSMSYSETQENIYLRTRKLTPWSRESKTLTDEQILLREQMPLFISELAGVGNKTFFLPANIFKLAYQVTKSMENAAENLSQKRANIARRDQTNALGGQNIITHILIKTLNSVGQSQSGSGGEKFKEMMQQLAGQQGQLNGQGQQILAQGGSSPGQLKGLAQQQRAIKEALERAARTAEGGRGYSNRLDEMAEEMEKIAELLESGRLDAGILERQRQLFKRMLESQKSIQQKEYSKKRKSERAKNYVVIKPKRTSAAERHLDSWENYFKLLLKQQLKNQEIPQLRQYYEKLD